MHQRRATYTVEEASSLLGISTSKLYRCIRAGELRALHVGRRVAISAPVLEGLLGGPVPGEGFEPVGPHHEEGLNRVVIVGQLAREPVLRTSRTGMPYATMRLAVSSSRSAGQASAGKTACRGSLDPMDAVKLLGGLLDLTGDGDGTAVWLAVEEKADIRSALLTEDTDGAVSIAAGVLADRLLYQIEPETIRQVCALEEVAC
jgi:excisionase family DNA binding protein